MDRSNQRILLGPEGFLAFLLLAALPVLTSTAFTDLLLLRQSVMAWGGAAILGAWSVQLLRRGHLRIGAAPATAMLLALLALLGIALLRAPLPLASLPDFGMWVAVLGIVVAIVAPSGRAPGLRTMAMSLGAGSLGAALVALLLGPELALSREHDAVWMALDGAAYAAIALPLCVAASLREKDWTRWLAMLGALASIYVLGSMLGHGVGLAALMGLVAFELYTMLERKRFGLFVRAAIPLAVAALMVLAVSAQTAPEPDAEAPTELDIRQQPQLEQTALLPGSEGAERFLIETGFSAWLKEPFVGHGLGQTANAIERYRATDSPYYRALSSPLPRFSSTGSSLLDMALVAGVFAAAAFLFWLVLAAVASARALSRGDTASAESYWGAGAASWVAVALAVLTPLLQLPAALAAVAAAAAFAFSKDDAPRTRQEPRRLWLRPFDFGSQASTVPSSLGARWLVSLAVLVGTVLLSVFMGQQLWANYHRQWGVLLMKHNDPQLRREAIDKFDRAIAMLGQAESYALRGLVQLEYREFPAAIASFQQSLALRPAQEAVHYALAESYRRDRELLRALEQYQAALTLNPRLAEARLAMVSIYKAQRDTPKAISELRLVLDAKPKPSFEARAHFELAQLFLEQRSLAEAERHIDLAARIASENKLDIPTGQVSRELQKLRIREEAIKQGKPLPTPGHHHGHSHGPSLPIPPGGQPPGAVDPHAGHDHATPPMPLPVPTDPHTGHDDHDHQH
ncbi:MAG: hypothetical protein RBU37_16795 [Myxococcota bacterium]|nr:hypothetical protein [Myxococcota bacterium]